MLNFPDAPIANQIFNSVGLSWLWDAVKWIAVGASGVSPPYYMTGSGTLPVGFSGVVDIRNGTTGPIDVFLPTGPFPGQNIVLKDGGGNAGTYPISINGVAIVTSGAGNILRDDHGNIITHGAGTIDGNPSYKLVSDYMSVEIFWMGDQWGTR